MDDRLLDKSLTFDVSVGLRIKNKLVKALDSTDLVYESEGKKHFMSYFFGEHVSGLVPALVTMVTDTINLDPRPKNSARRRKRMKAVEQSLMIMLTPIDDGYPTRADVCNALWVLANGLNAINRGDTVDFCTELGQPIWAPLLCTKIKMDGRTFTFVCQGGPAASLIVEKRFSKAAWRYMKLVVFGLPRFQKIDIRQFVGMRTWGKLHMKFDALSPEEFGVNSTFRGYNTTLLRERKAPWLIDPVKHRKRDGGKKVCLHKEENILCLNCDFGLDKCHRAVRMTTLQTARKGS